MDKKYLENTHWYDVQGRERIDLVARKMRPKIDGRYISQDDKERIIKALLKYEREESTSLLPDRSTSWFFEILNQIELNWSPEWRTDHEEMIARAAWCVEQDKLRAAEQEKRRKRNERKEVIMRKIRRIFRKERR